VAGAALTLLSSLLPTETPDTSGIVAFASQLDYPTEIVGVILLVVCLPVVFLRLRKAKGAPLALCGTVLTVAAGVGLTFGLGFAAGMGLAFRLGLITLLALPWSVMLPLPQVAIGSGFVLPNIFFISSTVVVGLGGVLLGVAMLRAGVLGRATGVALIVATVLSVIIGLLPLPQIPIGSAEAAYMIGLGWAGIALWRVSRPVPADVGACPKEVASIG
jgi:hypothetical protein